MGRKRLQPCSDKQVGGLPEQPVPDSAGVDDVATVGESSPAPSVYYDINPVVQLRLAEITRDLASLSIDDDSPQQSCVGGGINYPIPIIGHVVDDGNPTNALFLRKRSIYSNDSGPPAKKIRSGSLDRISDSPIISVECEGDVPAPSTSSYSTTPAVCVASTSSGGESNDSGPPAKKIRSGSLDRISDSPIISVECEGDVPAPSTSSYSTDDNCYSTTPAVCVASTSSGGESNDSGPPAKKIRSGSLDRISDSPIISVECEGDVPAPSTSSYSTTPAVCVASTSSGGESTPTVMRDSSSSSRDGDNVLNEEGSSIRLAAPLQTITSTRPCSSSAGDGRVKDPTVGATKQPTAPTPRAPPGSGKIMKDITNHYMKLSSKNKQAFAQRNMAILSKYADENGKGKDCKKKGVGNDKNKKKRKQIDKK